MGSTKNELATNNKSGPPRHKQELERHPDADCRQIQLESDDRLMRHKTRELLSLSLSLYQLGIFSINGERAYSLFVTNFGHADNSSTFVPCVKSTAAGFDRN